jgi:PadR family transcriptional regulator, regulatory protein PadR
MSKQVDLEEIQQGIVTELRRGLSVVLVLSRLGSEQYGYTLLKELEAAGLPVDQNTLYPLLRRLEAQGLLSSVWKVEEQRPRRYYRRTEPGTAVLHGLRVELASQKRILEGIDHEAE